MVVLATKCYVDGDARGRALDGMDALVDNAIGSLDVEWEVGVRHDDFVSVTITGDDAVAARNALGEAWGTIGTGFENGETYVGTLESWDEEGIVLDAGERIRISTDELGLGPGSPSQVRDRFGLVQHLPLQFTAGEPPRLADAERDRLFAWARGDNGRLNVNSATRGEVRATANRAGHARDIITVERLGLLEQSVVCAEGTDPPGLLASVGEYLPAELKCVIPG
jgi:hypothetical protein